MTRYELNQQIDEIMEAVETMPNAIHMHEEIEPIVEKLDELRSRLMTEGLI